MSKFKILIEEPKNSGNIKSINNNSQSHEPSIIYPSEDKNLYNGQNNEYKEKTKAKIFTSIVPKEINQLKNNTKLINDFNFLSKTNEEPKTLLGIKTERDRKNNEINQEAINQIETNKNITFITEKRKIEKKFRNIQLLKEGDRFPRKYALMLKSLKIPFPSLVKLIEYLGNKKSKLIKLNLDKVFSSTLINKKKLNLTLEQLICSPGYKKNKEILEKIKPMDEEDKKIYEYFLSRKYKFLLDNFFNNKEKIFDINEEKIKVSQFKTIDEVLEEKYKPESDEKLAKIQNIKTVTKIILDNFEHDWEERKPRKQIEEESFFNYEEKSLSTFNMDICEEDGPTVEIETEKNSNNFSEQLNSDFCLESLQHSYIEDDIKLEYEEVNRKDEGKISNKLNCSRENILFDIKFFTTKDSINLFNKNDNISFTKIIRFDDNQREEEKNAQNGLFSPKSENKHFNKNSDTIFPEWNY